VRITAQLNVRTGSHVWAERYDRAPADVFAVQDEITWSHRRRDRAEALCGGEFPRPAQAARQHGCLDLVMRALSHYWRVTRQDGIAQGAGESDRHRPERPGARGARTATFSAHMGWADMATSVPIAERALAAIGPTARPWAHNALACVYLFTRRFEDSLAELSWRCGSIRTLAI
jgi:hypothetical protein